MRVAVVILGVLALAGTAQAQENLVQSASLVTGVLARSYSIEDGPETRQFAFPIAFAMPVTERLSLDIGTYYASTKADDNTISGLTDTQVRASYVFGRDAVVATMMVNLPTGKSQTVAESFTTGAVAPNFLSFPVNVYRTGASVTGGIAAATELGGWNVGLATSLKYSGEYEPFSDSDSTTYSPGAEARFKLGLERLLGSSRLTFGFTFSTFGNDDFTNIGGSSAQYQPGSRIVGELALAFLAGRGTVTGYVWNYHRSAADGGVANKENIFSLGATGSWPIGSMRLEPLAEARFWSPEDGSGRLFGAGAALQAPLGERFTISPSARFDFGSTTFEDGSDHNLTGWGASVLLRYQL